MSSIMKQNNRRDPDPQNNPTSARRWAWLLIAAALIILFGLFHSTRRKSNTSDADPSSATATHRPSDSPGANPTRPTRSFAQRAHPSQPRAAEEIVAAKVKQFGRNRRELVQKIAKG